MGFTSLQELRERGKSSMNGANAEVKDTRNPVSPAETLEYSIHPLAAPDLI